ncbi:MAG: hypothetical protein KUL75_01955 [Sterolibacterium sp.]|nr:hypothetical protein [Sterolibacterium sp.]
MNRSSLRCGLPEWHGQAFDIEDERIPAPIRAAVARDYAPGYVLYFANTQEGGEWWLLDGEVLIDAYWLTDE